MTPVDWFRNTAARISTDTFRDMAIWEAGAGCGPSTRANEKSGVSEVELFGDDARNMQAAV